MMTKPTKKSLSLFVFACAAAALAGQALGAADPKAKAGEEKSTFEAEKAKALAQPYANDMTWLTPEERSAFLKDYEEKYLKNYPENHRKAFAAMKVKCAKCHEVVRPLNSQFFEPQGKDVAERKKKVDELKKTDGSLFKDKNVWQIEGDIWQRYVKRMMAKPGCEITKDEGKDVWNFLVYDSSQRKIGAKKAEWESHRKGLLAKFKEKYPARYKELYGGQEPGGGGKEAKSAATLRSQEKQ